MGLTVKLTKEIVNERLKDRGIELIGEYVNTNTKSTFKCPKSHEWSAIPRGVMSGRGCPYCSNRFEFTKEIVNERLKDRGIELIGEYYRSDKKTLFRCPYGHEWETKYTTIVGGHGCPHCSNNFPLTKKIVNERVKNRGIELIGDYLGGSQTKALFRCPENHEWETMVQSILSGRGCPSCSISGYTLDLPAHGYLLDFGTFIKFGISNVLHNRLRRHKMNGKYTVIETKYFENGQDALDWETAVKRKFGGNHVSKEICPDGYTETLPISLREELIATLRT